MTVFLLVLLRPISICSFIHRGRSEEAELVRQWQEQCATPSPCCQAWRHKVAKSLTLLKQQRQSRRDAIKGMRTAPADGGLNSDYDLYEPVWSCETRERVPNVPGDGPKWICGLDALVQRPCLALSFGSNGDVSFERAIKKRAPLCEIHTFDPTLPAGSDKLQRVLDATREGVLQFHPVGLGRGSESTSSFTVGNKRFPAVSLEHAVHQWGSRNGSVSHWTFPMVDVLKVDVEGAEFAAFSRICASDGAHFGQLLLEVHTHTPYEPLHELMDRLEAACGLLLFNKEANIWACVPSIHVPCRIPRGLPSTTQPLAPLLGPIAPWRRL